MYVGLEKMVLHLSEEDGLLVAAGQLERPPTAHARSEAVHLLAIAQSDHGADCSSGASLDVTSVGAVVITWFHGRKELSLHCPETAGVAPWLYYECGEEYGIQTNIDGFIMAAFLEWLRSPS